jgi:AraC-like DNA-binding protein
MLYLERRPAGVLAPMVEMLWLAHDPPTALAGVKAERQRVLPNGRIQLIFNLAADHLTEVCEGGDRRQAPALVTGIQTRFHTIATEDIADLAGVIVRSGAFWLIFGADADEFSDCETSLEAWLGREAEDLRSRLREAVDFEERFAILERWLVERVIRGQRARCVVTDFALGELGRGQPVREIARRSGWSERTLSERFRRQVGVTPKIFDRIVRFQRVVQRLHRAEVRADWAQLALDCGFYDQAHFSHEFRAFSGISATEYAMSERKWSNHLTL